MKKTLVTLLALVFVLSIGTAAFAAPANPFVDVPAKHWAYDAVSKLAKAGIVDGYGDGTFRGDKTISRYEMAQIVAKAMAKSDKADAENKALIDKLAVEFASELNNLGVRVAKLEANASSVKTSGDVRIRYTKSDSNKDATQLKFGLNFNGNVNDNVSFTGRIVAQNKYSDHKDVDGVYDNQLEDQFSIERAYVTVKDLGGMKFDIGRQPIFLGQGIIADFDYFDGAKVTFGNQLKVTFGYGDINTKGAGLELLKATIYTDSKGKFQAAGNLYDPRTTKILNLSYDVNPNFNVTAAAMYTGTDKWAYEMQAYGFKYSFNNDWNLVAEYAKNAKANTDKSGWYSQINYKGVDRTVPGSYGLYLKYNNIKANAIVDDYTTLNAGADSKGWGYGLDYAVAKNVQWSVYVEDLKTVSDNKNIDTWYRSYLKFWF